MGKNLVKMGLGVAGNLVGMNLVEGVKGGDLDGSNGSSAAISSTESVSNHTSAPVNVEWTQERHPRPQETDC